PRNIDFVPQLLAARKSNPDMVLLAGILPADGANAMKGMSEIGWNIPIAVTLGMGSQAKGMLTVMPADKLPNYVGQVYESSSYCSNTPLGQSSIPKTIDWLRAHIPDYDKTLAVGTL